MNLLPLDATDLSLVNALQISPRASWRELSTALGVDPVTLSQRWKRMSSEGLAWITCYPNLQRNSFAFVEIDCASGTRESIINALSKDSGTYSIDCTTGRRDLFLSVVMETLGDIDSYVENRVALLPGVNATRTHHVRRMFVEGAGWRVGVLPILQSTRLDDGMVSRPYIPKPFTPLEGGIMTALGGDARRSASSIAKELEVSVSAVTRSISRILITGRGTLRCDFAHDASPWKVVVVMWLSVPENQVSVIVAAMRQYPEVRVICSLVSEANIMIQLWTRALDETEAIEAALLDSFPHVRVLDRWVVPRIAKRMGHVLNVDGRRTEYVSVPTRGRY